MQFFKQTNVRFSAIFRYALIVSGLLIVAGVVSLVAHGGPRLSIDFTGGTVLQVKMAPAPDIGRVRSLLEGGGYPGVQVQDFGAADEFLITFTGTAKSGAGLDTAGAMKAVLEQGLPGTAVEMRREESVGPKIGGELKTAAFNSMVAALGLIIIYVSVRFIFKYGIAAVIALAHDVTITLGVFSMLNKEVSLSIIAAFLTIIGYSINDTIVVFDRIRENMKLRKRGESYAAVVDRSINETLSRTVITSLTTVMVSAMLYFFGGPVIHDFTFALTFGIVIGTYSSVFVAAPILVWWHERRIADPRRREAM
ncbi:MAG: protein translocase subunit SecF [bacterium]|nr:protein translocase subunit SecF [bacterium]